jgi:hypothetical protein
VDCFVLSPDCCAHAYLSSFSLPKKKEKKEIYFYVVDDLKKFKARVVFV